MQYAYPITGIVIVGCFLAFWFFLRQRSKIWFELSRANARVFISYRRSSTRELAQRLRDDLDREFGKGTTFVDEGGIEEGELFPAELLHTLFRSDVIFVLFEASWDITRLHQQDDWVRNEIRWGISLNKIVPVRVDACDLPKQTDLPFDIARFVEFQAFELAKGPKYNSDFRQLMAIVRKKSPLLALKDKIVAIDKQTLFRSILFGAGIFSLASFIVQQPRFEQVEKKFEQVENENKIRLHTYPFTFKQFAERANKNVDNTIVLKNILVTWEGVISKIDSKSVSIRENPDSRYLVSFPIDDESNLSKELGRLKSGVRVHFCGRIDDLSTPTLLNGTLIDLFQIQEN